MKRSLLYSTILSISTATGAMAGDWTGWYAGGQIGYSFGEFELNNFNQLSDFDADGAVGGLMGGYLQDYGDWVVGIEVQLEGADISINNGGTTGSFDGIARIKARGGRDFGNGLLYGTVGVAYTDFGGVSGLTSIDFDDPGLVVGLGYDYQLASNWVLGAEYQYHRFNDFGANGNVVEFGTVQARVAYRF